MTIIKKIIKKIVLKIMTKDKLLYYMLDKKIRDSGNLDHIWLLLQKKPMTLLVDI